MIGSIATPVRVELKPPGAPLPSKERMKIPLGANSSINRAALVDDIDVAVDVRREVLRPAERPTRRSGDFVSVDVAGRPGEAEGFPGRVEGLQQAVGRGDVHPPVSSAPGVVDRDEVIAAAKIVFHLFREFAQAVEDVDDHRPGVGDVEISVRAADRDALVVGAAPLTAAALFADLVFRGKRVELRDQPPVTDVGNPDVVGGVDRKPERVGKSFHPRFVAAFGQGRRCEEREECEECEARQRNEMRRTAANPVARRCVAGPCGTTRYGQSLLIPSLFPTPDRPCSTSTVPAPNSQRTHGKASFG